MRLQTRVRKGRARAEVQFDKYVTFGLAGETYGPADFRGFPTLFKLGPSW